MDPKHPMQPVVRVGKVARFKANEIVRRLLDEGSLDMNDISMWAVSDEDRTQFAQLIGYSVSGAGDLDYFDRTVLAVADEAVEQLPPLPPPPQPVGNMNRKAKAEW